MAISYIATGTAGTGSGTASSVDFVLGKPAGTTSNDVLVAIFNFAWTTSTTFNSVTLPAGWSVLYETIDSTYSMTAVYWKRAGGSESSNYTFTLNVTHGGGGGFTLQAGGIGQMSAFRGCRSSGTPIDVSSVREGQSTLTVTADAVTPSYAEELVLFCVGAGRGFTATTFSGYSGSNPIFTEALESSYSFETVVGFYTQATVIGLAYGTKTDTTTTSDRTVSLSGDTATLIATAFLITLNGTETASSTLPGGYAILSSGGGPRNFRSGYQVAEAPAVDDEEEDPTVTLDLPDPDDYTPATLDPWRPLLYPGDFFVGGDRYHLFAVKRTQTLAEITFSVFELEAAPIPGSLILTYDGLEYTDFFVLGDELHMKWRNPEEWGAFVLANAGGLEERAWMAKGFMGSPENAIVASYDTLVWSNGSNSFTETPVSENLTLLGDEKRRYYRITDAEAVEVEREGADGYRFYGPRLGPVVLTDDNVEVYDQREELPEFAVSSETGVLRFGGQNLLWNPAFLVHSSLSEPYGWEIAGGNPEVEVSSFPDEPPYGAWFLHMPVASIIYQTIVIPSAGPFTISFYARSAQSGQIRVVVNPIGENGEYLDAEGADSGTSPFSGAYELLGTNVAIDSESWVRYSVTLGDEDTFYTSTEMSGVPAETVLLEVRFQSLAAAVDLAAVQLEAGYRDTPFLGLSASATIEYEAAPSENYVPDPLLEKLWPLRRDDVDLNPVESEMPNGFLCFLDDGGEGDAQLGKGGLAIYQNGSGPIDVLGRTLLPYAKLSGRAKLVARQSFHDSGSPPENLMAPARSLLAAARVYPIIPESSWIEVSGDDQILHVEVQPGEVLELTVLFQDAFGNPLLGGGVEIAHDSDAGTFTTVTTTDRAGRARYTFIRQGSSLGEAAEEVEFSIGEVAFSFTIDLL